MHFVKGQRFAVAEPFIVIDLLRVSLTESLSAPEGQKEDSDEHDNHRNQQDENATPQRLDGCRLGRGGGVVTHRTTLRFQQSRVLERSECGCKR